MALVTNSTRDSGNPLRLFGQIAPASERPNYGRPGALRNFEFGEAKVASLSDRAGIPSGVRHPAAWLMPSKAGGLAARYEIQAGASFVSAGALGRNVDAALAGAATLSGIGDIIASAVAALQGVGSITGNVLAALQASAALAGQGSPAASLTALGFALAQLEGVGVVAVTPRASGTLAAVIDVAAQADLTAAAISAEILDQQMVETGLSVRETLRLCAAALAGKISGASGTTVVIRAAQSDHKDRITATVDASGNRSAVTLDLEG